MIEGQNSGLAESSSPDPEVTPKAKRRSFSASYKRKVLAEVPDATGRWHDNRHTLITELAESGASDQTIMDIAGHVSKQMLKHYSHIRMEAKRAALESIVKRPAATGSPAATEQNGSAVPTITHKIEGEYPQKSPQSASAKGVCGPKKAAKSLKRFGSVGQNGGRWHNST